MWRNVVTSLYPDILSRTYRVPPEHFNKVPYSRETVPGTSLSALVPCPPGSLPSGSGTPGHSDPPASQQLNPPSGMWTQEPQPSAPPVRVQESDIRDDFCQNLTLKNLQELGNERQEVMFIVSQINFGSCLNKPAYAAAAAAQFPRPINLAESYREGDFDILVIHRHHGILVGELKSVGMNQADLKLSEAQADANVAKKVRQAVKQLSKSETVLKHLISDIAPGLSVRKTLFLPFVSTAQLQRVLTADPQLEQVHTHTHTHTCLLYTSDAADD